MKSENTKNLLYDYVNDLLSGNEKTEFEKQLARSVDLQNELKRVKHYYSLVKASEPSEVPRDFIEKVHNRINEYESVNLQKDEKKYRPLKVRFRRSFPFEIAGVLATVTILVFIFIPNVNILEISRKTPYEESVVPQSATPNLTDNTPMSSDKDENSSEPVVPKAVETIDKKVAGNAGVSAKDKTKKTNAPKQAVTQNMMLADESKLQDVQRSASPVASSSLPMSRSTVAPAVKEETSQSAVPDITPKKFVEGTKADIIAMSSIRSEEKQASKPIRIIMRGTVSSNPELSAAPSSIPAEHKEMKMRRSERAQLKKLKTESAESEYMASKPSGPDDEIAAKVDKNEIESMFSVSNITWKPIQLEDKRLLYHLNGPVQAVKSVIDTLKSKGFIQMNMPVLSDDSVDIELEINY